MIAWMRPTVIETILSTQILCILHSLSFIIGNFSDLAGNRIHVGIVQFHCQHGIKN